MSPDGEGEFKCGRANGNMVARFGVNQNGEWPLWRCYGEFLETSDSNACIADDGTMTNEGCTDPDPSNRVFCSRYAEINALIRSLEEDCPETTTVTTTSTTTTTTTTTTEVPCANYLDENDPHFVTWKNIGQSTGFAQPRRVGDNSVQFQLNIPKKNQANYNPQTSDFLAFLVISRTECSQTVIRELENVNISFIQNSDNPYTYYGHKYLRWEGDANRRSFTYQFSRELNGATDGDASSERDYLWITLHGFSQSVMDQLRVDAALDNCLEKIQLGLLIPSEGIEHDYDHARCVGEQKLVGFR